MNRLLLVDGSNLLFQMYYGMPSRIVNTHGKAIHGTIGFTGALLKIIRQVTPTHIAVLFDGEHENSRVDLDADYKANRPDFGDMPNEETPFSQLQDIYTALDYLGICHGETTDCEADDWIAGYALTYGNGMEIVISSFDSDFFQLITDHVSVLRYRGSKTVLCTPDYLEEKFSIRPEQYADYKSLVGDQADNIKGADKVGPKTAAALLHEFGSLEGILANAENIGKPSIRESIMRNADRLRINEQLIRLGNCDSLPYALDELTYHDNGVSSTEVLKAIKLLP